MLSRRHVLALLVAAPALPACANAGNADPIAAWRDPGAGEADPRRFALAHAILAPSPHNTQPWLAEFDGEYAVRLFCDLDRLLPFTDPHNRQTNIGLGAFAELYRIAAAHLGYDAVTTPFPDGAPAHGLDARPVAHIQLTANAAQRADTDALFAAITRRRTNRQEYDARVPDLAALAQISTAAGETGGRIASTNDAAQVAVLRDLVWRGFDREMRTRGAGEETFTWLRFGREQINAHRDGLAIDGPMIPVLRALGQLDRAHIVDPDSMANSTTASDWRRKAETAPAFLWQVTQGDAAATRFAAGQAYARINLTATHLGLAMHPWSQTLQEYDEMADLNAEMRNTLGAGDGETVQMLVRVGYAAETPPSARRDIESVIRA